MTIQSDTDRLDMHIYDTFDNSDTGGMTCHTQTGLMLCGKSISKRLRNYIGVKCKLILDSIEFNPSKTLASGHLEPLIKVLETLGYLYFDL